jgi:2-amino-4-hydroxy-6-hydroxymethyldihydropteridine diphosphokinase
VASAGRVTAYIALGANLGDAAAALASAAGAIAQFPLTRVVKRSGVYKTAPLDTDSGLVIPAAGSDYLNAVIAVETGLVATVLLDHLQQAERNAGRERSTRNAPRTLDLDLLMYGCARMDSARLTVPHPRMLQRAFVLVPLAEIAPDLVTLAQLEAVARQKIAWYGVLAQA